jgi:hypothetical protein
MLEYGGFLLIGHGVWRRTMGRKRRMRRKEKGGEGE